MLQGFNSMQSALGLLPVASGSPTVGLSPMAPPPPPPQVPHPSEAAAAAISHQQNMMQQTLQAAQVTRYTPPPSAPLPSTGGGGGFGWGGAMSAMGAQQLNPFVAGALGGGGGFGMPNPAMMTSPSYGMFRPQGGSPMLPMGGGMRMPSIFNPFAPTMPGPHFASPAMYGLQMAQARGSQMFGAMSGVAEFGLGLGGSMAGGALGGAAFGPLGMIGGALMGGGIGHVLGNMGIGNVATDAARGRMIQNMSAPWMVSGSNLGISGQGFSASASREIATGMRHMTRDLDFERTGFNTQDAMRIMSQAGQHGLLTGVQNPDEMVRRVKDISKSVKMLMQITGDPDVRDAIASLGQMRNLGFQGLAAQSTAVTNRAAFARMAGVSQAAMHEMYGMPGAMMAQQVGLAGSTGYSAGMAGGALANMAASSGALNDLQLARAGGKSGLAQINTMAQISSMQSDLYLQAALKKGAGGKLEVDMDAYRRAQTMSVSEVAREAAARTQQMGAEGIFEWRTRRQEFKDQIAQKLTPFEMNMNVVRQAQALQKQVPGMNLGSAIYSTVQSNAVGAGMSEEQAEQTARALELQFSNRKYWEAQKQQLMAQRRNAVDQERARFNQFRTPGLMTRMRRGVGDFFEGVGDTVSAPFQRASDHFRRMREDEEAAGYGEHIRRISDLAIAHDPEERRVMHEAGGALFNQRYASGTGPTIAGTGTGARMLNRVSGFMGLSGTSDANRLVSLASESRGTAFGLHPLGSFGNASEALARVRDVAGAGDAVRRSDDMKASARIALSQKLDQATGGAGESTLRKATSRLVEKIDGMTAGTIKSATALGMSDIRQAYIESRSDKEAAAREFDSDPRIAAAMVKTVMATGSDKHKEVLGRSVEIGTKLGAIDLTRSREGLHKAIREDFASIGFGDFSDKAMAEAKSIMTHHSKEEVAVMAATVAAARGGSRGKQAEAQLADLEKSLGPQRFREMQAKAIDTIGGLSPKGVEVLRRLGGQEGKSGKDLLDEAATGRRAFGMKMRGAAADALSEEIVKLGGESKDDMVESLRSISDSKLDDLEKEDPEKARLIREARKGNQDAYEKLLDRHSPTQREQRYGGKVGDIDRQISKIDEMIAATQDGSDTSQLQAESNKLFADSVKTFADAVKDLKGAGEAETLAKNMPWWQSMAGGKS